MQTSLAVAVAPPAPQASSRSAALAALRDSGSVGLGLFPLGIALGVLVVHAGMAWWWAVAFAGVVYAGSLEFLLIGLVTAMVPVAQIALAAFCVNVRHVFYSLSFPLGRVPGRAGRAYSMFAMTDEAYALASGPGARSWTGRRILWLQAFLQAYWVAGAAAGGLAGTAVPARLAGLNFALTALFAVLAIDAVRAGRDLPVPVLALASALAARFVFPGVMLLAACVLFTAGLLVRYALARREAGQREAGRGRTGRTDPSQQDTSRRETGWPGRGRREPGRGNGHG